MSISLLCHFDGADQSTTFTDVSPSPRTISRTGTAVVATAQSKYGGSSLYLPGTSLLYWATTTEFNFGYGAFTLEAWVRLPALPTAGAIFTITSNWDSGSQKGWAFWIYESSGSVYLGGSYSTTGSNTNDFGNVWSPSTDTWYHLALVRYGGVIRLFVNGTQLGADISATGFIFASTNPVAIGGYYTGSAGGNYLTGYIDDLRILKNEAAYLGNFTPTDAPFDEYWGNVVFQSNFEGTNASIAFRDQSNLGLAYQVGAGAPTLNTSVYKYGSSSLDLTGATKTIVTYNNSTPFYIGASNFTMEAWININTLTSTADIINCWGVSNGVFCFGITQVSSSYYPQIYYSTAGSNTTGAVASTAWAGVTTGTWYHLAVVRTSNVLKFFVNGTQLGADVAFNVTVFTPANASATAFSLGDSWNSGTSFVSGRYFNGYIDSARVTVGVARYTTNFTAPTTEFWYNGYLSGTLRGTSKPSNTYNTLAISGYPTHVLYDNILNFNPSAFSGAGTNVLYDNILNFNPAAITGYTITIPEPTIYIDTEDNGTTTIAGTVAVDNSDLTAKRVRLIVPSNGRVVRETWSNPTTGYFEFTNMDSKSYQIWSEAFATAYTITSHLGSGTIYGHITDSDANPLQRRVVLVEQSTKKPVRYAISDSDTGYYEFNDLDTSSRFTLIAEDQDNFQFNDIIRSRVLAE